MRFAFFLLSTLLISSCGLFSANETGTYSKNTEYSNTFTNNIPTNWEVIKTEGSDFALRNKKNNSIFLVNSACRKHEGSSLNALTSSILSGIDEISIITKNTLSIHEREAQEIRVSGKVDGIKTFFNIVTLQKNYCIYDYVLISNSIKKIEDDYLIYKKLINGIKPE